MNVYVIGFEMKEYREGLLLSTSRRDIGIATARPSLLTFPVSHISFDTMPLQISHEPLCSSSFSFYRS